MAWGNPRRKTRYLSAATNFRQYFKGPDGDLEVYLEALKDLPKPN